MIGKNYGHSMQYLIVALIMQVRSGYIRDCIIRIFSFFFFFHLLFIFAFFICWIYLENKWYDVRLAKWVDHEETMMLFSSVIYCVGISKLRYKRMEEWSLAAKGASRSSSGDLSVASGGGGGHISLNYFFYKDRYNEFLFYFLLDYNIYYQSFTAYLRR